MLLKAIKALIERVMTDPLFRDQLERAETVQERYDLARAAGYEFAIGEFQLLKGVIMYLEEELALATNRASEDVFQRIRREIEPPAYADKRRLIVNIAEETKEYLIKEVIIPKKTFILDLFFE